MNKKLTIRKIAAVLLATVMCVALAVPAMAANSNEPTDITVEGGVAGATYSAFKLLNATNDGDKYAYTVNEKYRAALKEVTGASDDRGIIDYLSKLEDDSAGIRTFADAIYLKIRGLGYDVNATGNKFDDVAQGYYLIVETKTGNDQDTYSLVMLDTAGDNEITVTTKEDIPTLKKQVLEVNDSTDAADAWQDGADADIDDTVSFKLTGTLPDNYANYSTYKYIFHDTMDESLDFTEDSVKVYVDGTAVDSSLYHVETSTDDCTFDVVFDDLKKVTAATAESVITVEFDAVLGDDAVIGGNGNRNTAYLEYSNSAYDDTTSKSVEDEVAVFTYTLDVKKIDGTEKTPLEGAGFTLYKYSDDEGDYVQVGDEITNTTEFKFEGLDAGIYKLVESTVPDGYNKADDIEFTIVADYDKESDTVAFRGLSIKDKAGAEIPADQVVLSSAGTGGIISGDIANFSGVILPHTGGIGTTIFYIAGICLVVTAVILVVTKKRTRGAN